MLNLNVKKSNSEESTIVSALYYLLKEAQDAGLGQIAHAINVSIAIAQGATRDDLIFADKDSYTAALFIIRSLEVSETSKEELISALERLDDTYH